MRNLAEAVEREFDFAFDQSAVGDAADRFAAAIGLCDLVLDSIGWS